MPVPNRIGYVPVSAEPELRNLDLAAIFNQHHDPETDGALVPGVRVTTHVPNIMVVVTLVSALNGHGQIKDDDISVSDEETNEDNDSPIQFSFIPYISKTISQNKIFEYMKWNSGYGKKKFKKTFFRDTLLNHIPSPLKTARSQLNVIAKKFHFPGIKCQKKHCPVKHILLHHSTNDRESDYIIPWIIHLAAYMSNRMVDDEYICKNCRESAHNRNCGIM